MIIFGKSLWDENLLQLKNSEALHLPPGIQNDISIRNGVHGERIAQRKDDLSRDGPRLAVLRSVCRGADDGCIHLWHLARAYRRALPGNAVATAFTYIPFLRMVPSRILHPPYYQCGKRSRESIPHRLPKHRIRAGGA